MTDILIRGLDDETVKRLKDRAKRHGRSLQGEAKTLLATAAGLSMTEVLKVVRQSRKRLGRRFEDSVELIRKDRRR
jgi:plasmid stability protein